MNDPDQLGWDVYTEVNISTGLYKLPVKRNMDYIEADVYQCIVSNDVQRLNVFLGKGLSPNHVFRCTDYPERLGKTMLEIAVLEHSMGIIKTLLKNNCNPNLTYVVDMSCVGYTIKLYKQQDKLKLNVMFRCIVQGDLDTIRLLVQGGFDVNVFDDRGCSALWHAVDLGDYEMVTIMLSAEGSDVNLPDRAYLTCLHIAAIHGNSRILALLLRRGAEVDTIQLRGSTPLCLACRKGDFECVRYLLLNGANPNHMGFNGHTPLSCALQVMNNSKVTSLLVEAGARVYPETLKTCLKDNPNLLKNSPEFYHKLSSLAAVPQSLQTCCSLTIRQGLMRSYKQMDLIKKSYCLPLPAALRDYIILCHL